MASDSDNGLSWPCERMRPTCYTWIDMNHIKNSHTKNDWHMLCLEWRQITSNGITYSANFTHNNKLLSVGKSFSRLSLTPNLKNSVCLQCGNQIDNADKVSFLSLRLLRDKNLLLCYCSIAMTSPVESEINWILNKRHLWINTALKSWKI